MPYGIRAGDGEVYLWDVGKRACINRFIDSGSLSSTTLAVSPDGRYQAAGYGLPPQCNLTSVRLWSNVRRDFAEAKAV